MTRVCLLSRPQAAALEHDHKEPACEHHTHVSFAKALDNVQSGLWRWVELVGGKRRVTPCSVVIAYSGRPCVLRDKKMRAIGMMSTMQAVTK